MSYFEIRHKLNLPKITHINQTTRGADKQIEKHPD
jgi:hypothetical protein